jgi:hypothetical protein
MSSGSHWHNVVRLAWSTGGVVAINEPGAEVRIHAGVAGTIVHTIRISDYGELFAKLREQGLPTLAATFVKDPEELQGLRPSDFRAMSTATDRWLLWEARQEWRQIAFGAGRVDQMRLLDVASRVASALTYTEMRLSDLVNAYGIQLRGHLQGDKPKDYQAFKDLNSFAVYKAIHALFWELSVLRDSLAEFAGAFCFSHPDLRSMKGLRKLLRSSVQTDDLAKEIERATDPQGWVATFTSYRNLFTHLAPMEQAAGTAFAVQDMRELPGGLSVPQIYYALPGNLEELTRKRSKGALFNTLQELAAASSRRHNRGSEPDALEYLHGCIDKFAQLSQVFAGRSPIAPKPIQIGPDDLRGPVRVA